MLKLTISDNQQTTTHLPPKISENRLYPEIPEEITPIAPQNEKKVHHEGTKTPTAPKAPPPYSPNNPFIQAPVFEVKSGKLELNERHMDIPDDLSVEELTEMAARLGDRITRTQISMMKEREMREENESMEHRDPVTLTVRRGLATMARPSPTSPKEQVMNLT